MSLPPIYDPESVEPMWKELAAVGVEPLTTPEEVNTVLSTRAGRRSSSSTPSAAAPPAMRGRA